MTGLQFELLVTVTPSHILAYFIPDLLFVNDISCSIPNEKPKLFADDTNLLLSGTDRTNLNSCLNDIYRWCIANRLYLNLDKTKIMVFTAHHKLLRILQNKPYDYPKSKLYVNYNTLYPICMHIQQVLILVHKFILTISCMYFFLIILWLTAVFMSIIHDK